MPPPGFGAPGCNSGIFGSKPRGATVLPLFQSLWLLSRTRNQPISLWREKDQKMLVSEAARKRMPRHVIAASPQSPESRHVHIPGMRSRSTFYAVGRVEFVRVANVALRGRIQQAGSNLHSRTWRSACAVQVLSPRRPRRHRVPASAWAQSGMHRRRCRRCFTIALRRAPYSNSQWALPVTLAKPLCTALQEATSTLSLEAQLLPSLFSLKKYLLLPVPALVARGGCTATWSGSAWRQLLANVVAALSAIGAAAPGRIDPISPLRRTWEYE